MDGVVNAYVSTAALARFGVAGGLDEIRVILSQAEDRAAVERGARRLAAMLQARGLQVTRIEVPPPGQHPHQAQMQALLAIVAAFGLTALLLAGVLTAATMSALLAQQRRQIGIMKAIGARSGQIVRLYLAFVAVLALAALFVGLPTGYLIGQLGASWASKALNFELTSRAAPWWTLGVVTVIGVLVPLLMALASIRGGTRLTVRESIADAGVANVGGGGLNVAINAIGFLPRSVALGLCNTVRRRGRLALTLMMLATSGAVFMTALNVARSWDVTLDRAFEGRRYDLDVRLERPIDPARLTEAARSLPGVAAAETWALADAARIHGDEADVVTAYPGAVHGGLTVLSPPVGSRLIDLPLVEGRRLTKGDKDAVVVNRKLLAEEPDLAVGSDMALRVAGRAAQWRIVGVVDEPGSPPSVYVTPRALAAATGESRAANLRLSLADKRAKAQTVAAARLESALERSGLAVVSLQQTAVTRTSFDKHIVILVTALFAMAALVGLVGGVGLTSTLGINIVERTREFGIMQAIGARPRDIFQVVESEGLAIGALSWFGALLLSVPLTHALAHIGGHVGLGRSLDIAFAPLGMLLWLAIVLALVLLAGLPPSFTASRQTIRETLTYE